ncbi:hypothetical protein ACFS7Z_20870 [Pontibacter toksunensis]|uniref:Uncharacterized protein n=1 Tax=Pontibacter toksunensis TaxID=1332631 RepID=A0ABW6BYF8_9BACT
MVARIQQLQNAAPNAQDAEELGRLTELKEEYEMRVAVTRRNEAEEPLRLLRAQPVLRLA